MTKCIAPPRGSYKGEKMYIVGQGKCRAAYWDGQRWDDDGGYPICTCDACSEKPKSPYPTSESMAAIEGNTMDMERRIKYDDKQGCWRVIFNGKVTTDQLKTSGEAYALLSEFSQKKKEPKY
jgi:hypothetical protein